MDLEAGKGIGVTWMGYCRGDGEKLWHILCILKLVGQGLSDGLKVEFGDG